MIEFALNAKSDTLQVLSPSLFFCRLFIKAYGFIAEPLMTLLKKHLQFD